MSRINQPINQVKLTNVAIIKYNYKGKRFEVACYKNKIIDYRLGYETNMHDVLQSTRIFTNVNKGEFANTKILHETFATNNELHIAHIILCKGNSIHISNLERAQIIETTIQKIAIWLSENCINPGITITSTNNTSNTNTQLQQHQQPRPYTVNQMKQALSDYPIQIQTVSLQQHNQQQSQNQNHTQNQDGNTANNTNTNSSNNNSNMNKHLKKQYLDAFKFIKTNKQTTYPIERCKMELLVTYSSTYEEYVLQFIHQLLVETVTTDSTSTETSTTHSSNSHSSNSHSSVIRIIDKKYQLEVTLLTIHVDPSVYRKLITFTNEIHGKVEILVHNVGVGVGVVTSTGSTNNSNTTSSIPGNSSTRVGNDLAEMISTGSPDTTTGSSTVIADLPRPTTPAIDTVDILASTGIGSDVIDDGDDDDDNEDKNIDNNEDDVDDDEDDFIFIPASVNDPMNKLSNTLQNSTINEGVAVNEDENENENENENEGKDDDDGSNSNTSDDEPDMTALLMSKRNLRKERKNKNKNKARRGVIADSDDDDDDDDDEANDDINNNNSNDDDDNDDNQEIQQGQNNNIKKNRSKKKLNMIQASIDRATESQQQKVVRKQQKQLLKQQQKKKNTNNNDDGTHGATNINICTPATTSTTTISGNSTTNRQQGRQQQHVQDKQPIESNTTTSTSTQTCNTCGGNYNTGALYRAHYKSDWHRYNQKLKLQGCAPIGEEEFLLCDADTFFSTTI